MNSGSVVASDGDRGHNPALHTLAQFHRKQSPSSGRQSHDPLSTRPPPPLWAAADDAASGALASNALPADTPAPDAPDFVFDQRLA